MGCTQKALTEVNIVWRVSENKKQVIINKLISGNIVFLVYLGDLCTVFYSCYKRKVFKEHLLNLKGFQTYGYFQPPNFTLFSAHYQLHSHKCDNSGQTKACTFELSP